MRENEVRKRKVFFCLSGFTRRTGKIAGLEE